MFDDASLPLSPLFLSTQTFIWSFAVTLFQVLQVLLPQARLPACSQLHNPDKSANMRLLISLFVLFLVSLHSAAGMIPPSLPHLVCSTPLSANLLYHLIDFVFASCTIILLILQPYDGHRRRPLLRGRQGSVSQRATTPSPPSRPRLQARSPSKPPCRPRYAQDRAQCPHALSHTLTYSHIP